ncbi:hypothetical protein HanPI659440_Chr07g0259351 [Helianthus annuus]|nr:hypothetical protein HanPI659440_Chr07g0259351 [Helianthus annuus]
MHTFYISIVFSYYLIIICKWNLFTTYLHTQLPICTPIETHLYASYGSVCGV